MSIKVIGSVIELTTRQYVEKKVKPSFVKIIMLAIQEIKKQEFQKVTTGVAAINIKKNLTALYRKRKRYLYLLDYVSFKFVLFHIGCSRHYRSKATIFHVPHLYSVSDENVFCPTNIILSITLAIKQTRKAIASALF